MFRAGFFIDTYGIINLYGVLIHWKHAPGGRFRAAGPGFALCNPDLRESTAFCKQKSLSAINGQALAFGGLPRRAYMLSGALILNMVSTLWITPRTARHSAMRPCWTWSSASRMRQAL